MSKILFFYPLLFVLVVRTDLALWILNKQLIQLVLLPKVCLHTSARLTGSLCAALPACVCSPLASQVFLGGEGWFFVFFLSLVLNKL